MPKKAAASRSPSLRPSAPAPLTQFNAKELQLIDDKTLAKLLDIDPRTPAQWRYTGKFKDELPVIHVGRCHRYRLADVIALISGQVNQSQQMN